MCMVTQQFSSLNKMYIKNLKKHAVGKLKHQIDLPVEPLTI